MTVELASLIFAAFALSVNTWILWKLVRRP